MNRSIAYGLGVTYAGMMCLAISLNLLPVLLTTLSLELGGPGGLTNEQLGRLAAWVGVAADRFPSGGASMFGMLGAFGNLGCVVMPWVVGLVADLTNMRWGLSTATLCPLLMGFILLKLRKEKAAILTPGITQSSAGSHSGVETIA